MLWEVNSYFVFISHFKAIFLKKILIKNKILMGGGREREGRGQKKCQKVSDIILMPPPKKCILS
jgi:hypothetical protein